MSLLKFRKNKTEKEIKKTLQQEIDDLAYKLEVERRKHQFKLDEEIHKYKLKQESAQAEFDREKKYWEQDKKDLENRLNSDFENIKKETIVMLKLDSQQKIKQMEIDHSRELVKKENKFNEELTKKKQELTKKSYEDLVESFKEMQINGDKNSRFIQELSLKMIDKMPCPMDNLKPETPKLCG